MKNMVNIIIAGMMLFAAGCGHRYETFKLLNENHMDNTIEELKDEDTEKNYEKEDYHYIVERYVLVDKSTGEIYYFSSEDDTLVMYCFRWNWTFPELLLV